MAKQTRKKLPHGRPLGSRKVIFDEEKIKQVETMRGLGLNQVQISEVLGITDETLKSSMEEIPELKSAIMSGRAKAKLKVMETAYKMATNGKNSQLTMFWLRTQAGWKDQVEVTGNIKHTMVYETEVIKGSIRTSEKLLPGEQDKDAIDTIIDALIEDVCPSSESESD